MVHDTRSLCVSSIRIVLASAASLRFRVFSHDVKQAYVQSKYSMGRNVHVEPRLDDRHLFGLKQDETLESELPLNGVCDGGDYWGVTVYKHNVKDFGMSSTPGDQSIYVKTSKRDGSVAVDGVTSNYVDDSINAGNDLLERLTELTLKQFESKSRVYDKFDSYGAHVSATSKHTFQLDQRYYVTNLATLPKGTSLTIFVVRVLCSLGSGIPAPT